MRPVTTTMARLTEVTVAMGVRSWNAEWKSDEQRAHEPREDVQR